MQDMMSTEFPASALTSTFNLTIRCSETYVHFQFVTESIKIKEDRI